MNNFHTFVMLITIIVPILQTSLPFGTVAFSPNGDSDKPSVSEGLFIQMKTIQLTKGQLTLVDDEDFDYFNQWKWNAQLIHGRLYACRTQWGLSGGKRKGIYLHRAVMRVLDIKGIVVDHTDGNSLNNQKKNLRLCTPSQNCTNRKSGAGSSSKYLGVSWVTSRKRWSAYIKKNYKNIFIGHFFDEQEAARAYDEAAIKYHGEFANLNFIE